MSEARRAGCLLLLLPLVGWGAICSGLTTLGLLGAAPGWFVLAVVLATSTALPYLGLLLWIDRHEQEPLWLIGLAFGWGAMVATALSIPFNTVAGWVGTGLTGDEALGSMLAASLSAPFVEEVAKALAVAAIYIVFRREFDDVLDGVVYGAVVGLGFAWWENVTYYVHVGMTEGLGAMLGLTVVRGVMHGLAGHATFTGLTGLGFGVARVARSRAWGWAGPPVGLAAAISAHFAWNTFVRLFLLPFGGDTWTGWLLGIPLAVGVLGGPFLLLLVLVVVLSWRHQDALLKTWLSREGPGICPPGELAQLVPARRRTLRSLRTLLTQGPVAWWRRRSLDHALVELAFARWHHDREVGVDWPVDEDADVVHWRGAVRRWRAAGAGRSKL